MRNIWIAALLLSGCCLLAQDSAQQNSKDTKGTVTIEGCVSRSSGDYILMKQDPAVTYELQATGKNLHGAALSSFAKKCCKDQAAAQKLHGAAETSFTKKCLSDATGS